MTPERWAEVSHVFQGALELEPTRRSAYLVDTCGGDLELRDEVESLLRAHEDAGSFIAGPALVAATVGPTVSVSSFYAPQARRGTDLAPGRRLGPYAVLRALGAGGMGEVFLARHLALGRMAALKVLYKEVGHDLGGRLRLEAEAVARLQHPCIATFYELLEAEGTAVLALEYVPGATLRARLKEGPLPPVEAIAVAGCLLEALAHAHAAGILHRDIKPENVVLTGERSAKLLDFSVALQLLRPDAMTDTVTRHTGPGLIVGTVGYMSPEQVRGEPIDVRSDLFAVGAVLYEMLSGRPAFPGATPAEKLAAILSRDSEPLSGETLPPGLSAVVARALAREPARRYASARAFLRDLYAITSGEVVAALPSTLAVVDFENLAGDPALGWIGSGLAESLGADLAHAEGLMVVPREKVLGARMALLARARAGNPLDLGLELGCRWVISGRFEKAGERLRLAVTLAEVGTGGMVLEETAEVPLERIFETKARMAAACAAALNLRGSNLEGGKAPNLPAFEAYARGRRLLIRHERSSLDQAQEFFEQAVAADPGYAPALARLAGVHCLRYPFTTDSSELDRSLEYADRALALDPANAEAHIWRGYSLSRKNRLEESLESQRRAIELDPTLFYPHYFAAFVLLVLGRRREAMAQLQRAVVNEPKAGVAWLALGWVQTCLGLHGEASYSLGRALELENEVYAIPGVGGYLGENARRAGALDEARAFCLTGLEAAERSDHIFRDVVRAFGLCALGRIALAQEDTEAAAAAFSQALAQLRSRPHGVGGGHLVVQALAGLSQAGQTAAFDEACKAFASKAGFNFQNFYGCQDDVTLLELARAAFALDRRSEGEAFLARARAAGALEPLPAATPG